MEARRTYTWLSALCALAWAASGLAQPAPADLVVLRDGSSAVGRVVSVTADAVVFVREGTAQTLPRAEVQDIRLGAADATTGEVGWEAWLPCVWEATGAPKTGTRLLLALEGPPNVGIVRGRLALEARGDTIGARVTGVLLPDRSTVVLQAVPVWATVDRGPAVYWVTLSIGADGALAGTWFAADGRGWHPRGALRGEAVAPAHLVDETALLDGMRDLCTPEMAAALDAIVLDEKRVRKADDVSALNTACWLYENDTGTAAQSVADLVIAQGEGPAGYSGPYLRGEPKDPFTGEPYEIQDGRVVGPGDVVEFRS